MFKEQQGSQCSQSRVSESKSNRHKFTDVLSVCLEVYRSSGLTGHCRDLAFVFSIMESHCNVLSRGLMSFLKESCWLQC